MHDGQLEVSIGLVRRLLAAQVPELAAEPIGAVASTGTVNALFRVGDRALARLPIMREWSDPAAETATLAFVRARMSVRVPEVLLLGEPGAGYPKPWLLLDWIDGVPVAPGTGGVAMADGLAAFLDELWCLPVDGARAGYRAGLGPIDGAVRSSLAEAADLVDVDALLPLWDDALTAPAWDRAPRWTHSDLLAPNVLATPAGGLGAVLDWEAAGIGDPACDLMSAWSIVDAEGRSRLRDTLGLDDATWRRGRGWALAQAIIALPYYLHTNPGLVAHSRAVLGELVRTA